MRTKLPAVQNKNLPLSHMIRLSHVSEDEAATDIWIWYSPASAILVKALNADDSTLEDAIKLKEWAIVPASTPPMHSFLLVAYHSQLRQCIPFRTEKEPVNNDPQILAHPSDIAAMFECPVLLSSRIPSIDKNVTYYTVQRFAPPHEHGTIGLIYEDQGSIIYGIDELPESAQQLQTHLQQALEKLSDGRKEESNDDSMGYIVLNEFPGEVQAMVQQLAREYYTHHLKHSPESLIDAETSPQTYSRQIPATVSLEYEATSLFPLEPKKKRISRPSLPDTFDATGYGPIVTAMPIQGVVHGIQNAVSGADKWIFHEETHPVPQFTFRNKKGDATTDVFYIEDEKAQPDQKIAQQLWNEVKKGFTEQDIDIVLDIFSHLSRNMVDGAAWFFASNHLDNRGRVPITKADMPGGKRRRAGHRKEEVQAINSTIHRLEKIWLVINQFIDEEAATTSKSKKKRKKTRYTHTGRFLMVGQKWYQSELTGEEGTDLLPTNSYAIGWHIRPGEWLRTFLEAPNYQVARLCQTLLKYDPYRQQWPKRIGYYLMFHGHMHCKGRGGVLKRKIRDIIEEVSLPLDEENPARPRTHFQQAMNQLAKDDLIDGWKYEQELLTLPRKHWLDKWLDQSIMIYIAPAKDKLLQQERAGK